MERRFLAIATTTAMIATGILAVNSSPALAATPGSMSYTAPGKYDFLVPAGVTTVDLIVTGGGGGAGFSAGGGSGCKVTTSVAGLTPRSQITVVVGGGGAANNDGAGGGGASAFNPDDPDQVIAGGGGGGSFGSGGDACAGDVAAGGNGGGTGDAGGGSGGAAGNGGPGGTAGTDGDAGEDGGNGNGGPGGAGGDGAGGAGGTAETLLAAGGKGATGEGFGGAGGGGGGWGGGGGGGTYDDEGLIGAGGGAGGSVGPESASFNLAGNAGGQEERDGGDGSVEISWVAPDLAALSIAPTTAAFADVAVGTEKTVELTVTNSGELSAELTQLLATGTGVTITGGTCVAGASLANSESCTVILKWSPNAAGALTNGLLTISYNNGSEVTTATAAITGTAIQSGGEHRPSRPRDPGHTGGLTSSKYKVEWRVPARGPVTGYRVLVNVKGKKKIIIEKALGAKKRSVTFTRKQLLTATGASKLRGDVIAPLIRYRVRIIAINDVGAGPAATTFITLGL